MVCKTGRVKHYFSDPNEEREMNIVLPNTFLYSVHIIEKKTFICHVYIVSSVWTLSTGSATVWHLQNKEG